MKWLNGYRMRLMFVGFIAVILLGGIELANGATIAIGPGTGYDFGTIQAGIDAANGGDTVLVAPSEYVITVPITFRGKAIIVRSESGLDETTIQMGTPADTNRGSVVVFENNETASSVLDGFTITGGSGSWLQDASYDSYGGGIFIDASSGTVRNCAIVQNRAAGRGGGVLCVHPCSPTLSECIVVENSSTSSGGGISCMQNSSLTMTDCIIVGNSSGSSGGGVLCWEASSATLTNCIVTGNSADGNGGGVFCGDNSSMTMTDCIIRDNSAKGVGSETGAGGGVNSYQNSSLILTNCKIANNTAKHAGGGVECVSASVTLTNCLIERNTVKDVRGGGVCCVYANSSMTINNCTIWGNSAGQQGGGVACYQVSATVTNSIVWGNTAPTGRQISLVAGSTLGITYSNIAGGQAAAHVSTGCTLNWGAGDIDVNPLFARLGYLDRNGTRGDLSDDFWVDGDYHLKTQAGRWDPDNQTWIQDEVTSPCIDAGDPMSPIGLEPFPNGGFVNMGAYGGTSEASKSYFGEPVCETIVAGDINGDGQVNRANLEIMALHWTDDEPLLP